MSVRLVLIMVLTVVTGAYGASVERTLADRAARVAAQRAQIARLTAEIDAPLPLAERSRIEARLESVEALRAQRLRSLRRLLDVSAAAVAADVVLVRYAEGHKATEVHLAGRENAAISSFMRAVAPSGGVSLCFSRCPASTAAMNLGLFPARIWVRHEDTSRSVLSADDTTRVSALLDGRSPDFWVGEQLFLPSILDSDG